MMRPRWGMLAAWGGGCAIALIIIGALGAMFLRTPIGLLPASPTESYSVSTRAAQDILINQLINAVPTDAPAPLSTERAGPAPALRASLTPTSVAAIDRTPGAVNQAPTDRSATTATDSSALASPATTMTPDQPITTPTSAPPTRTHTPPRPTRTLEPVPPTRTHTPLPPAATSTPVLSTPAPSNSPLPSTASPTGAPSETTGDIRVLYVGYASSTNPSYEHISLENCDSKLINVANWKIKSVATGDMYTLPSYIARPGCSPQVRFTIYTHRTGNENNLQGIFTWDQPASREEWPNQPGKVEIYDSTGAKKAECYYQPDPARIEVSCK